MQDTEWFHTFRNSADYALLQKRPIAYFCAEFALSDFIQTFAGGLGVLAGDLIREASDQKIPLVAIGLYYREGYLHHDLSEENVTLQTRPIRNPEDVGLELVRNEKNERVLTSFPLQNRTLTMQAWQMQIGTVRIFLLDADIEENDTLDRKITDRLYTSDKELRFKQEMILGIGGLRFLETLQIHPSVYHLNEGHSAMLAMELAKHEMDEHKSNFLDALQMAKQRITFTNHTLLAAGNDIFSTDLVSALLANYSEELQIPIDHLVNLGKIQDSSIFSMTLLALQTAGRINAVSKLHSQKAHEIWKNHQMIPITNGIHIPTWDNIMHDDIMREHQRNKRALLNQIHEVTGNVWGEHDLLIGWARRMVKYKRPLALFEELSRFKTLAKNSAQPIRVVFAGQSHESDSEGASLLELLQHLISTELKGLVAYLPNYRMATSRLMVAGCDMWLNTPVVGFEACGTSGMKAALNGTLPFSTKDGWVDEVNLFKIGWLVNNENTGKDLLDLLEQHILPMYYAESKTEWVQHMVYARELILHEFTATTMLRKYLEEMYIPAMHVIHAM